MTSTDALLANSKTYAESFDSGDLPLPPAKKVAVVACMDARLDPARILGLEEGDAHVIRNAGGLITGEEIRSLAISQSLAGTEEIIVIHHTDCSLASMKAEEIAARLEGEVGEPAPWDLHPVSDLETNVLDALERLEESPFIQRKKSIRGFVFEVETGRLREVERS